MRKLVQRLSSAETGRRNVNDHMDEDQPGHERPHPLPGRSFGDIAVAFYGEAITVKLDVQPPYQTSAVECHATHEDVE